MKHRRGEDSSGDGHREHATWGTRGFKDLRDDV